MPKIGIDDVKNWSEVLRNVATFGGAVLALIWFWTTRAYKRQSEVELSCRVFQLAPPFEGTLAEIGVLIENKGSRRHTLAHLTICVDRLDTVDKSVNPPLHKPVWKQLGAPESISLHPKGRFVILQGISQEFTHTLIVPPETALIRITATFNFEGEADISYPSKRTARRVFDLSDQGAAQAGSKRAG